MRTTILAYAIALVGLITMALGLWGFCLWSLRGCAFVCAPAPEYSHPP